MALTEKQKQKIEQHKAEVAAREKAKAEKKKKNLITFISVIGVIVFIVCAITVPIMVTKKVSYQNVRLSRLLAGSGEGASEETLAHANTKVKMQGYLFMCQPTLLYMTTQTVSQCPYNASAYPTNYIPVVYKDGSAFDMIDPTQMYTVYGTLYVGQPQTVFSSGNGSEEARVVLYVDKIK